MFPIPGAPEGSIDSGSGEAGDQTPDIWLKKTVKFIHYTMAFSTRLRWKLIVHSVYSIHYDK